MQGILKHLQFAAILALAYPALAQQPQPDTTQSTTEQAKVELAHAVQNPQAYKQIPLKASLTGAPDSTGNAKLKLRLDPNGLTWATLPNNDHACRFSVVIAALGQNGDVLRYTVQDVDGKIAADHFHLNKAVGFKIEGPVAPGVAKLRIVVRDATTGKMGSTDVNASIMTDRPVLDGRTMELTGTAAVISGAPMGVRQK